ncbi:cytochrome P450 [Paraphoma chrysanthemicola]|nr:cytochrome P450 [Paraphoma chrysanthemicola]
MAPAVGVGLDCKVLDSDFKVDGHYSPQGCSISSVCRPIYYNTGNSPDLYKFRPERCLPGSSSQIVSLAGSALCAFFTGPRGCAGKYPALLEMLILLAKLMWRFELSKSLR